MKRDYAPGLLGLVLVLAPVAACSQPEPDDRTAATYLTATTSPDTPEWAKDAVWYQVFPERFRNGDPSNDPTIDVVEKSWPWKGAEGWRPTRWTSDWYARDEWEPAAGDFYTTVQMRRYGGDLQGMIDALPYLDSLGVTALYLNPMFDSPSLHKYDGSTFHHIDVHFGPDPEGDRAIIAAEDPTDPLTWKWTSADRMFLDFVAEAHRRGMRVVVDGVFNHMGLESFVFRDVAERQQASRFADWIEVTSWDDPATPDTNEFDYRGWVGVKSLPELREDEAGLITPVREYVFTSVARWMDPNDDGDPSDGIDGWRLDVAEMVDLDFWRDFRRHVRFLNPEAWLVGEVWWEDWRNHRMFDAAPWLQGDAFDAVMNYRWALAVRRLFLGSDLEPGQAYGPSHFLRELADLRADYPAEAAFAMMNTLGSHDTDRPASQVANPRTRFDHAASIREDRGYAIRRPDEGERNTLRLMLAQQFTYVGAPHLFYGDEAGMWGGDDPDERKPMVWPDLVYDDEAAHPFGEARTPDPVAFDSETYAWYRRLIDLRSDHVALRRGDFVPMAFDDASKTMVYRRTFGRDRVWVAFNLSETEQTVTFDASPVADPHETLAASGLEDRLGGVVPTLDGTIATARLFPRSVAVLAARPQPPVD